MEAVILAGIQGSGKTTFYLHRFADTHVRISLDMLRTRERERILLDACLRARQPFVVDNTNVRASERAVYVSAAKAAGFQVVAYHLDVPLRAAIKRNSLRTGRKTIPVRGVISTWKRLEPPAFAEGFDHIFRVHIVEESRFVVEEIPPG